MADSGTGPAGGEWDTALLRRKLALKAFPCIFINEIKASSSFLSLSSQKNKTQIQTASNLENLSATL